MNRLEEVDEEVEEGEDANEKQVRTWKEKVKEKQEGRKEET